MLRTIVMRAERDIAGFGKRSEEGIEKVSVAPVEHRSPFKQAQAGPIIARAPLPVCRTRIGPLLDSTRWI